MNDRLILQTLLCLNCAQIVPILENNPFLVIFLYPLGCLLQIILIDDIVPFKYAAGLVARNHHSYPLRDPGPHHVSNGGPSEVVE